MDRHRRRVGVALAGLVPLGFLGVFFAWPVASILARGLLVDGALDLGGFAEVFDSDRTWRIIGQTLAQSVAGTTLAVLLGVPGAYVLYRCRFPGRAVVRALVTVPFVLPTVVVGVAFRSLLVDGGALAFLDADGTFAAVVAA
ncbi:MAG: iron ABC transporter permease, partial [Actinomycetota bacterium]|nr:iron ABC transporter permease [Actinomycetota bacterium]